MPECYDHHPALQLHPHRQWWYGSPNPPCPGKSANSRPNSVRRCWFVTPTTAESLRSGVLLLPSRPNRLRLLIDDALAQQTAPEPKIVEVDSLPALLGMVEGGAGYTVLPYSTVAPEVERGVLGVWDLEFPQLLRTLVLVRPTDRQSSPANAAVEAEIYALVHSLAPTLRWKPYTPSGEILTW